MLGEQIIARQLTNKECTVKPIHVMKITMRFMQALRQKYIDHHPDASMTNYPPLVYHPKIPWVLSCKQEIIVLSIVHNLNNIIKHCCFIPNGNSTSTTLVVDVTLPDYERHATNNRA